MVDLIINQAVQWKIKKMFPSQGYLMTIVTC